MIRSLISNDCVFRIRVSVTERGDIMRQGSTVANARSGAAVLLICAASLFVAAVFYLVGYRPAAANPNGALPTGSSIPAAVISDDTGLDNDAGGSGYIEETGDREFILSFAGDCTFGTQHENVGFAGTFDEVVGNDYEYPFKYASAYFLDDDFTMVNLEGVLSSRGEPAAKQYRFRGKPEYTEILTRGGVECVSLANNHTGDYGAVGLADTQSALDDAGVAGIADAQSYMYETERGLVIGVCAYYSGDVNIRATIASLREKGAQIIVASFHFGTEGSYYPSVTQISRAHAAIDYGADIVFGHHTHVLQKVESYKGGMIYYSLGNFSFGGNRNPSDRDTAIIRQHVTVSEDGAVSLDETELVPFCMSSSPSGNNFQPMPYESGTAEYERVLSKLNGTFKAPVVETPPAEADTSDAPEEQ